ncbi:hypothetical protein PENTCL1PPCAC_4088, partial [Pristionchus entomophagus]
SAARHRARTKEAIEAGRQFQILHDQLVVELRQKTERLAQVEHEKDQMLQFLLTHECVSSTAHREQLYNTFCRSNMAAKIAPNCHSSARIEPPCYELSPPLFDTPCMMEDRPIGFCLEDYPEWLQKSTVASYSARQPKQQHALARYNSFAEFLDAKGTGFTPAPGHYTPLADAPAEPIDEYFVRPERQLAGALPVLSDDLVEVNLSYCSL